MHETQKLLLPEHQNLKALVSKRVTTLEDAIADELNLMIIKGEVLPGQLLNQSKLAVMFGVSRIPVRAALRRLHSQGLVTIDHHGAMVAKLDEGASVQIYLVRDRLEPWLAARACLAASEEDFQKLSQFLSEMEEIAVKNLPGRWVEIDREFHIRSYRPVLTPPTEQVVRTLWNSSQAIRRAYISQPDSLARALGAHRDFFEAYTNREPLRVTEIESKHIRETIRKMVSAQVSWA